MIPAPGVRTSSVSFFLLSFVVVCLLILFWFGFGLFLFRFIFVFTLLPHVSLPSSFFLISFLCIFSFMVADDFSKQPEPMQTLFRKRAGGKGGERGGGGGGEKGYCRLCFVILFCFLLLIRNEYHMD